MIIDSETRARCEFQLETINMFNRQLFVLATARSFTFLPTGEVSTTVNQIIKVSLTVTRMVVRVLFPALGCQQSQYLGRFFAEIDQSRTKFNNGDENIKVFTKKFI